MKALKIDRQPQGTLRAPPSTAQGALYAACAALADGESFLGRFPASDDGAAALQLAKSLGAECEWEGGGVRVFPRRRRPQQHFRAASSLLCCCLAIALPRALMREGTAVEAKDGVLPLASPLFRALSPRGVEAGSRGEVYGRLSAGKYFLDPCDAPQALAALLISLPLLKGDSEILLTSPLPSRPFAEMALSAMARFGVYCDSAGPRRFFVPGRQSYTAADVEVEGDWAAGGAYLASGALGADVAITGLDAHSEQPGAALLKFFEAAGIGALREGGALRLPLSQIRPTDWDVTDCFEAAGTMASLLSVANGRSSLINPGAPGSGRRRRMEGLASLIRDIGGQASVGDRALVIDGVPKLKGGAADSLSDPRIAMAAATCSPACPSDVFLAGPECVSRICKDFWRDFMKAGKGAAGRRPWP